MLVQRFLRAGETGFIYLRAFGELIQWQPNLAATGQVPGSRNRMLILAYCLWVVGGLWVGGGGLPDTVQCKVDDGDVCVCVGGVCMCWWAWVRAWARVCV